MMAVNLLCDNKSHEVLLTHDYERHLEKYIMKESKEST